MREGGVGGAWDWPTVRRARAGRTGGRASASFSNPLGLAGIRGGSARGDSGIPSLSATVERPTQNWHGQGESDCLIKTKHCDGRKSVLTQCDFCPVL